MLLCERCGEREASLQAEARTAAGTALRASRLCGACAQTPRRIGDPDVGSVLTLEASGRVMPDGWYALAAEDFGRRAAYHGDAVPPDVADFIARHQ